MGIPADDKTTRDGFFSSPRFQRDSGYGVGSIVATIFVLGLAAFVISGIVKQFKAVGSIQTSRIYADGDNGKKISHCTIYSDGSSDGC